MEAAERAAKRHEIASALLLSIAVTFSALCAYEATRWSGEQSITLAQAAALRTESAKALTTGSREITYDTTLFVQLGMAYSQDNILAFELLQDRLARPEFARYLDEWIALRPLKNPSAPRTPFELPDYANQSVEHATELGTEAEKLFVKAKVANKVGDDFVLATVFFSCVLFFGGIATKFESRRVTLAMLVTGTAWLLIAVVRMFTLRFI
ncbi:MAG: hypothetical protein ABIP89_25040 [Polyangiaceae bacterium]